MRWDQRLPATEPADRAPTGRYVVRLAKRATAHVVNALCACHGLIQVTEDVMKVLVDGDRGYIGAVLVPYLQALGHEVVGLDVGWYDGCDFGPQPERVRARTGDIRDVRRGGPRRALTPWSTSPPSPTTRSAT